MAGSGKYENMCLNSGKFT